MADSFGTLLRNYRAAADISMGELARRIKYSKGHVSKIENDLKSPTAMFAKMCDRELATDGALAAAVRRRTAPRAGPAPTEDGVWVMALDDTGTLRFDELSRRQVLAGAGAVLGFAVTRGSRPAIDEPTLAVLRASFDQNRLLGTMTSPTVVLAPVIAHLHTLRTLAVDSQGPMRAELLLLASRVAEYAGWMCQEAGQDDEALRWTDRAVAFAGDRDPHLASFALFRRAEIAMYRHDPIQTVELARRAQHDQHAGPRILGLAARCEAQGHALAGDVRGYEQALERAADLLAFRDHGTAPVLGSASVADDVSLVRGWALYDLGRPGAAAEVLDQHVGTIPPAARRARTRFGARRALAHAQHGDIDEACAVARGVLAEAAQVDSATIRLDLRDLAGTLSRWRNHGAVRELRPDLVTVLNETR